MKNNREFTKNSRLYKVKKCEEFITFKDYIIPLRKFSTLMSFYRIKDLCLFYNVDPDDCANSFNEMKKRIQNGDTLYKELNPKTVGFYSFIINKEKPLAIILPGGGYGDVCSFVEGFPIALKLNELGINAIIAQYRVGKDAHYPNPMDDLANIIRYLDSNKDSLGISLDNYALFGFSAGGHLAASFGTKSLGYKKYNLKEPKAIILSYPVISMDKKYTHLGTHNKLLGKKANKELEDKYSIEKQIDKDYPKTFIWQGEKDNVVPFKNSLLMVESLKNNEINHKFISFDLKKHGLGLGTNTIAKNWINEAIEFWLK